MPMQNRIVRGTRLTQTVAENRSSSTPLLRIPQEHGTSGLWLNIP